MGGRPAPGGGGGGGKIRSGKIRSGSGKIRLNKRGVRVPLHMLCTVGDCIKYKNIGGKCWIHSREATTEATTEARRAATLPAREGGGEEEGEGEGEE